MHDHALDAREQERADRDQPPFALALRQIGAQLRMAARRPDHALTVVEALGQGTFPVLPGGRDRFCAAHDRPYAIRRAHAVQLERELAPQRARRHGAH